MLNYWNMLNSKKNEGEKWKSWDNLVLKQFGFHCYYISLTLKNNTLCNFKSSRKSIFPKVVLTEKGALSPKGTENFQL